MSDRIYLSPPHMGGAELGFVQEAFASNWISTVGPNLTAFEAEMEAYLGRPCVALASGTAAIHLGLRLLGVEPGDEVLCPTLTFVASANPVLYLGAKPIFVDSERVSWNLDPDRLEEAILARRRETGRAPKALVVVDLYGQTADYEAIERICREHGVAIFEDAAEALGGRHGDRPAATLAPHAAISFNGNKIITTSGGGMFVCASRQDAEKVRFWSTQARDPGISYEHSEVGYNYRMSNIVAGVGRGQLQVLDDRVAGKRAIFDRYVQAFEDLEGLEAMPEAPWGRHTRWLSCFTVDEERLGCGRDALIAAMAEDDIEARPVWKPMHLQRLFEGTPCYGGDVAADLFQRGLCLPSGTLMSESDQERVIHAIRGAVRR